MKKILFAILLLCSSLAAYSQTASDSTAMQRTEEYVLVVASSKLFSTKVTIALDYGQERNFWSQDSRVKDETGKVATFNSVIDALNYMNSQGWKFVTAYTITIPNAGNVYHYMMRREIKPKG